MELDGRTDSTVYDRRPERSVTKTRSGPESRNLGAATPKVRVRTGPERVGVWGVRSAS